MGIFAQTISKIHEANGIKAVTNSTDINYPQMIFDKTATQLGKSPPTNSNEYLTLYGKLAPIYRAVSIKARTIAQLPIQILKQTKDNEFEDVTFTRPEYSIFTKPNEFQTKFDFYEQTLGYLQLVGESPWLLQRKGIGGKVTSIYPIRPDLTKIIPHNRLLVSHYLYSISSNKEIRIDPEFMLFMKFFNPTDYLRGLSPIAAAENEVVLDLNAIDASRNTFNRGAQPSGLISTDEKISDAEGKKVKKYIEDNYTGSDNFGKIMYLTHGFKWQQMQMNNRDMQYMEQREWNKETIAQVFGVPPILQMKFKDSSVLQNTEIQYKLFWDGIKTELTKLEEIITMQLLPEITDQKDVCFKFDLSKVAALQPDMTEKVKRYKEVFGMGGVTPNELRQEILGKDPEKNPAMDMFYVPFNLQPIEMAEIEDTSKDLEKTIKSIYQKAINLKHNSDIQRLGGNNIGEIKANILEIKTINDNIIYSEYRQKTINRLNKINQSRIKSFKTTLAKLFKEQKDEVIDSLYRNKYHKFSTDGVNIDTDKWVKKFKEAGKIEIAIALEEAAKDLAAEFEGTYDVLDPNAKKFVNNQSRQYAEMVNKTSRDKIDKILKTAVDSNWSIEETAAKLTEFFNSSGSMRSLRIARTEMVRATNEGRQFAAKQLNIFKFKEWVTQRDGMVRDSHVAMDGEVAKIDDTFSDGSMIPMEINERCYIIYRKTKG